MPSLRKFGQSLSTLYQRAMDAMTLPKSSPTGRLPPRTYVEAHVVDTSYPYGVDYSHYWGQRPRLPWQQLYPSSNHDQYAVYFYLKAASKFRLEIRLIAQIIDMAEYWVATWTEVARPLLISEEADGAEKFIYLQSQPIVGYPRQPVRKIVFYITSHDQGRRSVGEPFGQESYAGSWTWFEAVSKAGPSPHNDGMSSSWIEGPIILHNAHGVDMLRIHEVCWPSTPVDPDEAGESASPSLIPGETQDVDGFHWHHERSEQVVRQWIRELRVGDVVAIEPKARFAGWTNIVYQAVITVCTSFIRPP